MHKNEIILGDCLTVMKRLKDNSVDHIVCDLPFYKVVNNDWDNQWNSEFDYLEWCKEIILEYKRILKENGNLFIFTGRQFNRHIAHLLDSVFTEKKNNYLGKKKKF